MSKDSNFKKYWHFFWTSWTIQMNWNYERQMNLGYMNGMAPIINSLYRKPEELEDKKAAYRRHNQLFNCTPQLIPFVMGITASMEEEYYRTRNSRLPTAITNIKTSLMGPLAGVGDSFFQGTLRVIAFGLGMSLAKQGSVLGPILAIVISLVPSILITYYGGKLGYRLGDKFIDKLSSGKVMDKFLYITSIVGLMVVGGMVASLIGLTTPITYGKKLVLQDVLDKIMPQLIPFLMTMFMFWLIKRKVSTTKILIIAITLGLVLSVLGILK